VSDYDIETQILRQVRGGEVVVRLVQVLVEPFDEPFSRDSISVGIWPKSRQIEWREDGGRFSHTGWPADWPADTDYTQIDHEAALVALATRLAVAEWQRRQEGGR
jgi:hypothetical protein